MTDGEEINEGKKKRRGKKKDENPFPLSPLCTFTHKWRRTNEERIGGGSLSTMEALSDYWCPLLTSSGTKLTSLIHKHTHSRTGDGGMEYMEY